MKGPTQLLFEALPPPGEPKTIKELVAETGLTNRQVSDGCAKLSDRGFVDRIGLGRYRLSETGELARKSGIKMTSGPNSAHGNRTPGEDTFRIRLWRALRNTRKGTVNDLMSIALKDGESVNVNTAHHYLRQWRLAGFVTILPRRQPGTAMTSCGFAVYLLAVDPGPLAPIYNCKRRQVLDPNSDSIVWEEKP